MAIVLMTTNNDGQMQQLCKVCGELAAGFHFGAFTCEGCKSFFGRMCKTVDKPLKDGRAAELAEPQARHPLPECKSGGKCSVQGRGRTSCKRCRWDKCVQAKMSRLHSRYGRRSHYFKVACLIEAQDKGRSAIARPDVEDMMVEQRTTSIYKPLAIVAPPSSYAMVDSLNSPWRYSPPKLSPFWGEPPLYAFRPAIFPALPFVMPKSPKFQVPLEQKEPLDLSVKKMANVEPLDLRCK